MPTLDALMREIDDLRRELQALRGQVETLRHQQQRQEWHAAARLMHDQHRKQR